MPPAVVAPPTPSEIDEKKRRLRAEMIERRKRLADADAGRKLVKSVAGLGPFRPGTPVSGYYPMPPEIDVLPVLSWFTKRGHPPRFRSGGAAPAARLSFLVAGRTAG